MGEFSEILHSIGAGDPRAAAQLLPLVYEELRKLAAQRLAFEAPGQTLQPTALVHEAYLRLAGGNPGQLWQNRGHFFSAAAEAMRRILIEKARRKKRSRHGGRLRRVELTEDALTICPESDDLIAFDEALVRLAAEDRTASELVRLRVYAGLSLEQAADTLGLSRSSAYRQWIYARAWLGCALREENPG